MHKEQWTLQNRNIHHLNFEEPLDSRNLVASVPNDNPESLARANRIVADHNALAGLNPDAVRNALTAFEAITVAARLEKMSLFGPAWRDLLEACEQALKNLKGE